MCASPTNTVSTPTKRPENQLPEACELYNAALQEGKFAARASTATQAEQLKPMREEGLLGLANFSCCQDVLRRLDQTFQAFFARVRRGEKPGFPRFRSFRRYDSITFPSYGDGCRLLDDGELRIQGAGLIKVKLQGDRHGVGLDSFAASYSNAPGSGVRGLTWRMSSHACREPSPFRATE